MCMLAITGNRIADKLAKEVWHLNSVNCNFITFLYANVVLKFRFKIVLVINSVNPDESPTLQYQYRSTQFKTSVRLRISHYKVMKINRNGRKTYRNYNNCLHAKLTPIHTFGCLAIFAALKKLVFHQMI